MGLFNFLKPDNTEKTATLSHLHLKIKNYLPQLSDEEITLITCIAGLLARVAWVDFQLHPQEIKSMKQILKNWSHLTSDHIDHITDVTVKEIQTLAGLENHLYCHPLKNILDESERYNVLTSLFALAAGDGSVENLESEEIRLIAHGLNLTHKHYIAARATVHDKLLALKK